MSMLNEIMRMNEREIASLHDFSCDIDEMRNDIRNEKLRAMIAILLKECYTNGEIIALATEMECIIDEIKKFINNKHKHEVYHLYTYDENGNTIIKTY